MAQQLSMFLLGAIRTEDCASVLCDHRPRHIHIYEVTLIYNFYVLSPHVMQEVGTLDDCLNGHPTGRSRFGDIA